MQVTRVETTNFRNLIKQTICLEPTFNLIVGRNGQGKTNFLEALSVLSNSKSFRSAQTEDLINHSEKQAQIRSEILSFEVVSRIEAILHRDRKEFFIDGRKLKSFSELIGKLSSIYFYPADLGLIKDGPTYRRTFVDKHRTLINPTALTKFYELSRVVKNKLRLIKDLQKITPKDLEPWNKLLAETSIEVWKERDNFIKQIGAEARALYFEITDGTGELRLRLKNNNLDKSNMDFDILFGTISARASEEIARRTLLVGAQQDEIEITIDGKDTRKFASQGEARSIVLALKMATITSFENERKESPLVLFDDVDAELDIRRKELFFNILLQKNRQIIVTSTEELSQKITKGREYKIIKAEGGFLEG
ncbi:MAG TPA: DNA replication and repair protein RecF [Oligoflexia bacterium]|nr:DNA replication and repair protein RecF [Oligoflexia bacterium]HMP26901.1 DNA replication and repair protein RecF [Oligoflexia bacterium]